eukprot:m.44771 g.44771  ORF g.44771 m.44771 type:complete len:81 (-) comp10850_c0_seq1:135-377(-)
MSTSSPLLPLLLAFNMIHLLYLVQNKEHLMGFPSQLPAWSRKNIEEYGYGMLEATNASQLVWQYFAAADNSLLDTITITK